MIWSESFFVKLLEEQQIRKNPQPWKMTSCLSRSVQDFIFFIDYIIHNETRKSPNKTFYVKIWKTKSSEKKFNDPYVKTTWRL